VIEPKSLERALYEKPGSTFSRAALSRREPKSMRWRLQAFAIAASSVAGPADRPCDRALAQPNERGAQALFGDAFGRLDGAGVGGVVRLRRAIGSWRRPGGGAQIFLP